MPARRFPPPWSVEEQAACFVVRHHKGQQLAYVYFEDEPGRQLGGEATQQVARRTSPEPAAPAKLWPAAQCPWRWMIRSAWFGYSVFCRAVF